MNQTHSLEKVFLFCVTPHGGDPCLELADWDPKMLVLTFLGGGAGQKKSIVSMFIEYICENL